MKLLSLRSAAAPIVPASVVPAGPIVPASVVPGTSPRGISSPRV